MEQRLSEYGAKKNKQDVLIVYDKIEDVKVTKSTYLRLLKMAGGYPTLIWLLSFQISI